MGERTWKLGLSLAGAAVVVGGWLGSVQKTPAPAPSGRVTIPVSAPSGTIRVHVAGWVASPGVVSVPDDALVADAVAAAGGLRAGAFADAINLAAPVSAGAQIVVPGPDGSGATNEGAPGGGGGPISINHANASDLESLPGVGPVLAARIVAHRDRNGPFETVEDLLEVPGIGEAKLAALRDLITVP